MYQAMCIFVPVLKKDSRLSPLYKHTHQSWCERQQKAFQVVKDDLVSAEVLAHYDPDEELILQCDVSPLEWGQSFPTSIKMALSATLLLLPVPCPLQKGTMLSWTRKPWQLCLV